jgi:hypothetical protein
MLSQNANGGRGGPWGSGAKPGSDIEDLVRQGQDRLKQIMPEWWPAQINRPCNPRSDRLRRMDGLLHCAERLCRCRAAFR